MDPLELSLVTRPQGANAALLKGEVSVPGVRLHHVDMPVLVRGFRRMVRSLDFDVCEMALTTYLCAREHGVRFTALPIFLVRGLHHGAAVRAADRTIKLPADLRGARVGVNRGYTVTTGVWVRAILEDRYGVDLDDITWSPSGDEHVATYQLPPNVVPLDGDTDLAELVIAGQLDAAIGISADRPGLAPLLEDHDDAAWQDLVARELYPINHLVVVRDELLQRHPELGPALFEAFTASKQAYLKLVEQDPADNGPTVDELHRRIMTELHRDPLPYGIEPNGDMLEHLLEHATRQRILRQRPRIEDVFHAPTHGLTG